MRLGYGAKRFLDYAVALGGLAVASPVMVTIAAAIKMDSDGGVFFKQERLGRNGRRFSLVKFRTMHPAPLRYNEDGSTRIDANDDRVTRVGRYLRGGLDELPQLWNVLRGDMSLVGPRPDLVSHREQYAPGEERKLEALPGITSLPVVLGRTEIPWKRRIAIDIAYIDRWSLTLDVKIVVETLAMALGLHVFDFAEVVEP